MSEEMVRCLMSVIGAGLKEGAPHDFCLAIHMITVQLCTKAALSEKALSGNGSPVSDEVCDEQNCHMRMALCHMFISFMHFTFPDDLHSSSPSSSRVVFLALLQSLLERRVEKETSQVIVIMCHIYTTQSHYSHIPERVLKVRGVCG